MNGKELYNRAEALASELEGSKEISTEQVKKFEKIVKEFFKEPNQECYFTSTAIWKKINDIFEDYFKKCYSNYSNIVLQCYIDGFFAKLIERYDLNTVNEIMYTEYVSVSDEILDFLFDTWDEVKTISSEVAEYLAREHVDLGGMTKMKAKDGDVMSKFIDHPGISEREGLWIRVWITHEVDNKEKLQVRMIIVPQEKGGEAIPYDITLYCKDWIDTLA